MAFVEIKGLRKEFGDVKAVNGVDMGIEEGEFVVILGPSGCGKTTLMRMIAGLEKPTEGEIIINGRTVTELPPRAREIAMVFQSYALYPHMSIFENISFPLRARKQPKGEIKEKVEWAAGILGIERLLERRPRQLSGGERQRAAVARALINQPSLVLADEPTGNLDPANSDTVMDLLFSVISDYGSTLIMVTHDQNTASRADSAYRLVNGKLVLQ